jgi:hypothetical protein
MPESILKDATSAWANEYKARQRGKKREVNSYRTMTQCDDGWLYADTEMICEATVQIGHVKERNPRR